MNSVEFSHLDYECHKFEIKLYLLQNIKVDTGNSVGLLY